MEKKLLIISYVYPPDNSVGGRRWSKFAKCLAETGNKVFVITATPDKNNEYSTQNLRDWWNPVYTLRNECVQYMFPKRIQ